MKPVLKLYLLVFLLTGISFALLTWLSHLIFDFPVSNAWLYVFIGGVFGLVMSITLVTLSRMRHKKIGISTTELNSLYPNKSSIILSSLDKNSFLNALQSDPFFSKMQLTETSTGFILHSPTSIWSWGEIIEIRILQVNESQFEYHISSKSRVRTTIIDYGINLENVRRIEQLLTEKE